MANSLNIYCMTRHIPTLEELKTENFAAQFPESGKNSPANHTPLYGLFKRALDIVGSMIALALFLPFWILIIILIRLDSKGPAIFSHERAGLNGKKFRLYKFRTMHADVGAQEYAPATADDKRVTRIGKFLRHTSLDEVPQFWNVLIGSMSLVGPRPEMTFIVEKYNELQKKRLLVKPGLTGLWQIYGRKDIPLHENAEYDYWYILHRSLGLDLLILLKTITVVVTGKGAY